MSEAEANGNGDGEWLLKLARARSKLSVQADGAVTVSEFASRCAKRGQELMDRALAEGVLPSLESARVRVWHVPYLRDLDGPAMRVSLCLWRKGDPADPDTGDLSETGWEMQEASFCADEMLDRLAQAAAWTDAKWSGFGPSPQALAQEEKARLAKDAPAAPQKARKGPKGI